MSAERRQRIADVARMRELGFGRLSRAIVARLAREVAADPTTDPAVRAEIERVFRAQLGGNS